MSLLSKNDIFAADDRSYEDVKVPEWINASGDCEVRVRGLNGTERDAYEASIDKQVKGKPVKDYRNFRARLVALSVINEDGSQMFEQNEVAALAKRSSAPLSRLFDVACRLSGITDEDVEALEGNSEPAQSGPATSDLPSPSASPLTSYSPAPVPSASPNGWPTNGSTDRSVPSASTTSQP